MKAYIQEQTVHSMASQSASLVGALSRFTRSTRAYLPKVLRKRPRHWLHCMGDDGHQSTKVLDDDGLGMRRSSEGLCMGDDECVVGTHTFSLCIGHCLLALLPGDVLCIDLVHGE
jgi:hypothetical protein